MLGDHLKFIVFMLSAVCIFALPANAQAPQEETLAGPDAHEAAKAAHGHLFGDWGGARTRLLKRGVKLDLHYLSDSLWNVESQQKERFASYDRVRGTVDVDLGTLVNLEGLSFHATAVWQAGGNLGAYLGLIANPSGIANTNTFRLDSWWIEKRWLNGRVAARLGQFAGQDTYGDQDYGKSYVFVPLADDLDNLFTTIESFDPPSTPAMEISVAPLRHVYVKSMVLAGDRAPFSHNPTGLVPQFRGTPVSVSEVGFTPGKKASAVHGPENVESRKGYSGLYQFGAAYNPGNFTMPASSTTRSGNYLLYWMASQSLWRVDPKEAKGVDGTFAYDWSPANVNRNNTTLSAGLRFNEPLPLRIHNTMALGYVQNSLSPQFLPSSAPAWKTERGTEFNALFLVGPLLLQPVIQYYADAGGGSQRAVVLGFRTKVEF